ncbi:MAG: zinc-ribbon domain-containing protein [Candidatus Hodarchaeota archaeon]
MPKFCVYCGKEIKGTDKFCIHCGKPLLTDLPKTDEKSDLTVSEDLKKITSEKKQKKKAKKEKVEEKVEEEEIEEVIEEEIEEVIEEEIEEKKKEKKEKEVKSLPDDVKEHIEIHLQLNAIREKKKTLAEKLMELQKMVKSPQYDTDFEFGEKINVQLKAVKSLIEEVKQKENELQQRVKSKFIVEKLNMDIAIKRDQLKNLMREHKLKKIRDKDVVKKLKEKYTQELEELINQKEELVAGIFKWIEEIIDEKNELTIESKFNKARFSSKEISEDVFKEKDNEFEKQINKLSGKINTLKKLIK